jgi:hypothetical protein
MRTLQTSEHRVKSDRTPGVHIFVLIDALGWKVIEGRRFLDALLPFRRPLRTVLGFSSGAIPTILTGRLPSETGHWNLFYFDPKGSPFWWLRYFRFLPPWALDHRVGRKLLKELGRRFLGLGPLFECCVKPSVLRYFNWVERRNIYEPRGITNTRSIFDELLSHNISHRVYTYHDMNDRQIVNKALQDIAKGQAQVLFLYLSELDMFLHTHCNDSGKVGDRLHEYDLDLARLYEAARERCGAVSMTIFSDHGMTPVREHYDLVRDIEALPYRSPADYLTVYDSTMARFWFFSDEARVAITKVLSANRCGRILSDAELRRLGVLFEDRRFGDLVFLLHPGWLIAESDFNGHSWKPAGMHGYHPEDCYSDAVFLSNRRPPFPVESIADVFRCMKEALNNARGPDDAGEGEAV